MHILDGIRTSFTTIADRIAASRRASRFICGDCDRNERCDLPPDVNCIAKASQMARDGGTPMRLSAAYNSAVWPS